MARGSLAELETLSIIARDLNCIEANLFDLLNNKTSEVSRMLNALIRSLNKAPATS